MSKGAAQRIRAIVIGNKIDRFICYVPPSGILPTACQFFKTAGLLTGTSIAYARSAESTNTPRSRAIGFNN
jgi:hypothetical protein